MIQTILSVLPENAAYPVLLKELPDKPSPLYYLGKLPNPDDVLIAVVGTRKATREGLTLAKQISRDLARNEITVVSGLALGIDAAAHEGALNGGGKTIAVLANGLDTIYPRSHENLAKEILKNRGAIFSEYAAGTPAYPNQFLERNRVISGLSTATVIVESPIHSGALVTGRHGLDQGREIFVLPGPAQHPNYRGSHLLIRNGARLVTSADEILEDLNIAKPEKSAATEENDPAAKLILKALRNADAGLSIDKIIEATKLEPHIANQRLTFLSFEGLVKEKNGKFFI